VQRVVDSRAARGRRFDSARRTCREGEDLTGNFSPYAHVRRGEEWIDHHRIASPPTQERDQILASVGNQLLQNYRLEALGAANDPDTHTISEYFFGAGTASRPATSSDHQRMCQFSGVSSLKQ
jgi:hypothetical protein